MDVSVTHRGRKLLKLMEIEGYGSLDALLEATATDAECPAICMAEGCDHVGEMEPDQDGGYCEACGGNTMVSALVLVGVI